MSFVNLISWERCVNGPFYLFISSSFFFYNLIAFSFDNEVCGVPREWDWEIKLSCWFVWSWARLIPLFGPGWLSLTQDLAFTPGTGVPPLAYLCLVSMMESLPGGCDGGWGAGGRLRVCLTVAGAGIEGTRALFFIYNGGRSDGKYGAGRAALRKEQRVEEVKGECWVRGGLGERVTHTHWEANKPSAVPEHQLTGAACVSSQHP